MTAALSIMFTLFSPSVWPALSMPRDRILSLPHRIWLACILRESCVPPTKSWTKIIIFRVASSDATSLLLAPAISIKFRRSTRIQLASLRFYSQTHVVPSDARKTAFRGGFLSRTRRFTRSNPVFALANLLVLAFKFSIARVKGPHHRALTRINFTTPISYSITVAVDKFSRSFRRLFVFYSRNCFNRISLLHVERDYRACSYIEKLHNSGPFERDNSRHFRLYSN